MNGRVNTKWTNYEKVKQSHRTHSYPTVIVRPTTWCHKSLWQVFLLERRRGGKWHTKGSKQATKVIGKRELHTTDEILRLRKKAAQNKYKQMSKSERAKRRQQRSTSSHQMRNRTRRKQKRWCNVRWLKWLNKISKCISHVITAVVVSLFK